MDFRERDCLGFRERMVACYCVETSLAIQGFSLASSSHHCGLQFNF